MQIRKNGIQNTNTLIISYPFPPIPYSGTYRILRLCKGLVKKNIEIHVLSIKIDKRIPNDNNLLFELPGEVKTHRTHIIDPWQQYRKWKNRHKQIAGLNRYVNKFASFIMQLITIPDHQIFWLPFAFIRALKIIKKYHIRNVIISSPPVSSLLTGCLLKKFADINFIADLRDPIVGNIAQVHLINPKTFFDKLEQKILKYIETIIVKSADTVVTNTQTHNREMKEKYKTNKFVTIRNAFDRDDYKGIKVKQYNKFTISHLGGMYGLRRADVLFKAIKILEKEILPAKLNLQVLFVGSCDKNFEQDVKDYDVEKYVKIVSRVPHQKAMEIMVNSHLLLLVKATGKGSLGQIPAKFFEYLGTKNKIICLGSIKSEVAGLIKENNAGITIEDDVEKLAYFIINNYNKYLNDNQPALKNRNIDSFDSDTMASKFSELFDNVS